jgi:dihydroceramidase
MAGFWLVAIGVGSFLFHATMRYSMQLLDELPMVGFVWTTVMHKTLSKQQPFIKKYATYIQVFITLQAVLLVTVYTYFGIYELFLHGFTFMVLNDGFFAYMLRWVGPHASLKQKIHIYGTCFIVFGKLVWEIENQLCLSMPAIWPMHTIWHFGSAASAYSTCFFNHVSCLEEGDDGANIPALFGWKSTVAAENKSNKDKQS